MKPPEKMKMQFNLKVFTTTNDTNLKNTPLNQVLIISQSTDKNFCSNHKLVKNSKVEVKKTFSFCNFAV